MDSTATTAVPTVKVTGLTRRGLNKVAEARKRAPQWNGCTWRVVQEVDRVLFSNVPGPWLEVMPDVDPSLRYALSRWVHSTRSEDFRVERL